MEFDEIVGMIFQSCNKRFQSSTCLRETILACATQIYIAEMKEKKNAEISEKMG